MSFKINPTVDGAELQVNGVTKLLIDSGGTRVPPVADIASAATIDLTAYGSGFIATVTGATPITTLVMSDGQFGTIVASGLLPFTYHATTNKLVGGADVTAYAGQYFRVSKTGGVVSCEPIAGTIDSSSRVTGPTRAKDVIYQNTGTRPRVVYISASNNTNGGYCFALVGTAAEVTAGIGSPQQVGSVHAVTATLGVPLTLSFIVPSGAHYQLRSGGGTTTVHYWNELN